jgi:hypothetical protein
MSDSNCFYSLGRRGPSLSCKDEYWDGVMAMGFHIFLLLCFTLFLWGEYCIASDSKKQSGDSNKDVVNKSGF